MDVGQSIRLVIVTGMSGAGKTQALKHLEDLGFFCVDNLPPSLMPKLAELFGQTEGKVSRLALGIDIRGGRFFNEILGALRETAEIGVAYQILFMDASDEVLVRRYKESRRRHPLAPQGRLLDGIQRERKLLQELRGLATFIVDTTHMTPADLRKELSRRFGQDQESPGFHVNVVSFGFKNGAVLDADLLFDVRFLPNPHYVPDLQALTGEDPAVDDVRDEMEHDAAVLPAPGQPDRLPAAALRGGGQEPADHRHRLHGRPAPLRVPGPAAGRLDPGPGLFGVRPAPGSSRPT